LKNLHPHISTSPSVIAITIPFNKTSQVVFFQKNLTSFETSAGRTTFFFFFFSFKKFQKKRIPPPDSTPETTKDNTISTALRSRTKSNITAIQIPHLQLMEIQILASIYYSSVIPFLRTTGFKKNSIKE